MVIKNLFTGPLENTWLDPNCSSPAGAKGAEPFYNSGGSAPGPFTLISAEPHVPALIYHLNLGKLPHISGLML